MILILIAVAALSIWAWIKLINSIFKPLIKKADKKRMDLKYPHRNNPYVQQHLMRQHNDKLYDDYIEWMDRNNHGLPVEKFKFPEEEKFEKELMRENKKKRR